MSKTDAIRVIVGDGSRVDRDLVRFMLERDGFRVISSVAASEDLSRAAGVMQPDAVVLGEELLDVRGAEAARLVRHACPMAKIVLFSALPAAAAVGPGEPDAVLERGIGLKDLTPQLNNLFEPAAAGAGVVTMLPTAAASMPSADEPAPTPAAAPPTPPRGADSRRRSVVVLTAAAAAMLLLIFAVARTFPANDSLTRASSAPSPSPGVGSSQPPASGGTGSIGVGATSAANGTAQNHVTSAMTTLQKLEDAIRAGSGPDVVRLALQLRDERAVAQAAGEDVSRLNQLIGSILAPLTGALSPQVGSTLRLVLGTQVIPPFEPPASESPAPDGSNNGGGEPTPTGDTGPAVVPPPTDTGSGPPVVDGGGGGDQTTPPPPTGEPTVGPGATDSDIQGDHLSDTSDKAPGQGEDGFSSPPESGTSSRASGGDDHEASQDGGANGASPAAPIAPAAQANAETTPPGNGNHLGWFKNETGPPAGGEENAASDEDA